MGQAPKEAERTAASKPVHFVKWKTVASGSGRAAGCMELVGKKGLEQWLEKCADTKVDIEALERLMEPEDAEVL